MKTDFTKDPGCYDCPWKSLCENMVRPGSRMCEENKKKDKDHLAVRYYGKGNDSWKLTKIPTDVILTMAL